MKRENMKTGLIVSVIVMMFLSTSIPAMGSSITQNNIDKNNMMTASATTESLILDFGDFEPGSWSAVTQVIKDDFDNTGDQIDWAPTNFEGIYSELRDDEDLSSDGTSAKGAWCIAAAEQGSVGDEDSQGYSKVGSNGIAMNKMRNPDYSKYYITDLPGFKIKSAALKCDYKFGSDDFDHGDGFQGVLLVIYITSSSGGGHTSFFKLGRTSTNFKPGSSYGFPSNYPAQGKCVDYWDPDDNFEATGQWEYDSVNDYSISEMYGGGSLADWLNDYGKDSSVSVKFHLAVRLIGQSLGDCERFKFWLDDVRIECTYEFIEDPTLSVSNKNVNADPREAVTGEFYIKNSGVEPLDWKITKVEPKSGYDGIPDTPTFSTKQGDNLNFATNGGDGHLVKMTLPENKNKHNGKTIKWQLTVDADYDGDGKYDDASKTMTVTFSYGTVSHSRTIFLNNLLQERFPQLFALLQRLTAI